MASFTFTNKKTGQVVTVYASGESHARRLLAHEARKIIEAKLPANKGINTIEAVVSPEGNWLQAGSDRILKINYKTFVRAAVALEQYDTPNPFQGLRGY